MQHAFPWWQVALGLDFAPGRQLCLHSILVVFVSQACLDSTARYVQSVYPHRGGGGSASGLPARRAAVLRGSGVVPHARHRYSLLV